MKLRLLAVLGLCSATLAGCTGLAVGPDYFQSSQAADSLGAQLVRVEFGIGASCSSMTPAMNAYAAHGAHVLALAGFDSRIPSVSEAQSLNGWATCFGAGSSWAQAHDGFELTAIEFGNETSYCHQFWNPCPADWYNTSAYAQRARDYASRFMAARQALDFGGHSDVQLLAQADDGGSGSPNWVNNLAAGGLTSAAVDGWTVHPYGTNPATKLNRLASQTATAGFSSSIKVNVTEYGVASQECNGSPVALSGNGGWPTGLSYAQAAADLNTGMDSIRNNLGDRLGAIYIFKAKDDNAPCGSTNGEQYFGGLKQDLTDKPQFSGEVRDQLGQ